MKELLHLLKNVIRFLKVDKLIYIRIYSPIHRKIKIFYRIQIKPPLFL